MVDSKRLLFLLFTDRSNPLPDALWSRQRTVASSASGFFLVVFSVEFALCTASFLPECPSGDNVLCGLLIPLSTVVDRHINPDTTTALFPWNRPHSFTQILTGLHVLIDEQAIWKVFTTTHA